MPVVPAGAAPNSKVGRDRLLGTDAEAVFHGVSARERDIRAEGAGVGQGLAIVSHVGDVRIAQQPDDARLVLDAPALF